MNILNYGGGTQSVAVCVLIARGALPRPDHILIADTGYEVASTWRYLEQHIRPLMSSIGLTVHVVSHYSRYGLTDKHGGLLVPMFTSTGQLRTFCSANWKRDAINSYLRRRGIRGFCKWIGFSLDERRRATLKPEWGGIAIRYPLLDLHLTREDCKALILSAGLPLPRKSRCWLCPYQSNSEWQELRDTSTEEWQRACQFDEEWRDSMPCETIADSRLWLHNSRAPLSQTRIDNRTARENRQCGMGMCFL